MSVQIIMDRDIYLDAPVTPVTLTNPIYAGDADAQRIRFRCFQKHGQIAPMDLSEITITAHFIRPDGGDVVITGTGGSTYSYVDLPEACYVYPGIFKLLVRASTTNPDVVTSVLYVTGRIDKPTTDVIIDPGTTIPSLEDLLAQIDACEAAEEAANAAAASATAAAAAGVRTDTDAQGLTDTQKANARTNIGAADAAEVSQLSEETELLNSVTITESVGQSVEYTSDEQGCMWRYVNNAWEKTQTSGVAYYHVSTFPVTAGSRYRVYSYHTKNCPAALFWTADGTTPFAYSQDGFDTDRTSEWVTLSVTVPENATKMTLTGNPLTKFPTANELDTIDTGVAALNEYANGIRFLKTTGFHIWDRAQRITIVRENKTFQISFPYQFYVSGTTGSWVKTITLQSGDSSYRKNVTLPTNSHIVYNPDTNDIEIKDWSGMGTLSGSIDNYLLLGTNIEGTLFGPLTAVLLRNLETLVSEETYQVPYYYFNDSYLETKVSEIEAACAFQHGVAFPFITDIHLQMNYKQSGKLIRYLKEHTNAVPFVVSGGDIPYSTDTEANVLADAQEWLTYMSQWGKDITLQTHGNHDYMCNLDPSGTYRCSLGQLNYYIGNNGTMLTKPNQALYGYYDVPGKNVRIIITDDYDIGYNVANDTWDGTVGYTQTQLDYIKARILDFAGDIIVISHQTSDLSMSHPVSNQTLQNMLIAAKNKTGDFSAWTGDIVMHLSGHTHKDESHVQDNLLSVSTLCDAHYKDPSDINRPVNTVNEQAFDMVCIDTDAKTIKMVRIGAGESRSFSY